MSTGGIEAAIAHLEFGHEPACGNPRHTGPRPPAEVLADMHGCDSAYLCANCKTQLEQLWEECLRQRSRVPCPCGRVFTTFGEAYTMRRVDSVGGER